jgi:hypothetical protein
MRRYHFHAQCCTDWYMNYFAVFRNVQGVISAVSPGAYTRPVINVTGQGEVKMAGGAG